MPERLSILNDPAQQLGGPQLLHHLIDWENNRGHCALDFKSGGRRKRYNYNELRGCVAQLTRKIFESLAARKLRSNKQPIVPILLPQCPALYIAQLAVLTSAAAFCPINLDAPKDRIKFVVDDVGADIIITTSEFQNVASWEGGPMVILVEEFPETIFPQMPSIPSGPAPESLAYVMYTSGSSGKPKGVGVSHLAVCQSLLAHEKHIPQFKRFLQFAAPSFDVSVFEIFFPLIRGCTLVGCDRVQLLNDLPGTIVGLEIDAAELTPTVVGSLLQKRTNAPCLKLLLTIGEMLTWPIVEEFGASATQDAMLYGMYGPTEAAIHCTIFPAMKSTTKPGNIGIPFDTVSTFIAKPTNPSDEEGSMTVLPVGKLGELVLGGTQLAQGYLNREEQNKLAFVQWKGRRYYRTGDKARQLEDGTIEILGRISAGQVKLRGQRIELGEIEEVIYKHPGIKTVVAMVLSGTLIVFALVGENPPQADDVQATCAKWLPKFMIPSEIILIQQFPYLPSGKVDKRQLEADYLKQRDLGVDGDDVPQTSTEKTVKNVLQECLGSFNSKLRLSASGLDSLMAIRVAARLRSEGFGITTLSVLQAETLSKLAKLCDECTSSIDQPKDSGPPGTIDGMAKALNGSAKDVHSTWPCTPLQSAMLAETLSNSRAYKNWVEIRIPSIKDVDQIYSAIHDLAQHNAILRTGFAESPDTDGFVQVVWTRLQDSQIEKVQSLDYDWETLVHESFHHPLKFQILVDDSDIRILIHIHHALYDAWSLELLVDDLDALLGGKPLGERPPYTDIVKGYQDGTLSTNEWPSTQYWKDHLDTLDPTPLPNFHTTKSPSTKLETAHYLTSISTAHVEACAMKLGCSSQSFFQAAYAIILGSYLGMSDICFGTVFSGRTLPIPGIEEIAGPTLATLPVRTDISSSTTLRELVSDLNSINRAHLEHSTKPLRDIKGACGIQPGERLFDTLVIWQQTLHSFDHKWEHVTMVDTIDNLEFDLTLEIIPGVGNVELKANYQQSIFPKSQTDFLLQQVAEIAGLALEAPDTPLDEVFQHLNSKVLSIENPEPIVEMKKNTLSSIVERIAVKDPNRPAIDFAFSIEPDSESIESTTYSKLNTDANRRADYLMSSLNVLPNDLVAICMEKSIELYTCILATAKIGAGYLPLTPDTPDERLRYILQEANVGVVLTHSGLRHLFKPLRSVNIVYVDEIDFSQCSKQNTPSKSKPEHISYCVFTSGSTGTPKGVLVTQGNLLSNLDVLEDIYPADSSTRLLQSCSQAFDVSVFELFFTWRVGGCICAAIKDVVFRDIEQAINILEVTHLSLTPTVAALVNPDNVPKVKFLVTAGEAVTQKVFNTWADRGLFQGYGPSETTNICTVNPNVTKDNFINNIGPPFKNTSAFVLSREGDFSPVPRGGEGEFCFGGSQVFRGYMDPSQQIGKIIEHPKYGRLYRSGDFGRLLPDGSLDFTGRKDDQVKVRGQRVELGEINNVVLRSEEVRDCYTMVYNVDNDSRLVCFWTDNEDGIGPTVPLPPDSEKISRLFHTLESALPAYMIPSSLVQISHLPPTTQGKIDKRFLVDLYASLDTEYLAAVSQVHEDNSDHEWTGHETDIAKAVSEVSKTPLEQIFPDTSFFALGIDSISAISLARVLRSSLSCQVEISQILKNPSVRRLANIISSSQILTTENGVSQPEDFAFDQEFLNATVQDFYRDGKTVQHIVPCTPLQEAMLSAGESSEDGMYSNKVVMRINGDLHKIQTCWQKMVDRHEILRTCFLATDLKTHPYVQVVLQNHELEFLSGSTDALHIPDAKSSKYAPPYTVKVAESGEQRILHISMHHALYDGVALSILYEEVEKLYHDEELLPPVSFAPFIRALTSMDLASSENFWSSVLRGFNPSRSFVQHKEQLPGHPHAQSIKASFPLSWLDGSIKKNSTSLLAVCHSAWAGLIAERAQDSDVCFGTVVSGRTIPVDGIERLVAPCFNTIPARLQNIHNLSNLEAFRKLQTLAADSLPFQLTPLRRIQSKFSPDGSRLFDTLFILQQPNRDLNPTIWTLDEDTGAMDFPVVCEVVPRHSDDTLEIILHSNSSILSPDEAVGILKSFEDRLQTSLRHPRQQILSSAVKERIFTKSTAKTNLNARDEQESNGSGHMTEEEKVIRDVLADFTDVPRENISKEVSIFRLGLDSISAVQVGNRLRKLGHQVMASDVLEHPTISKLALHVSSMSKTKQVVSTYDFDTFDRSHRGGICEKHKMSSEDIEAIRPCTAIQRGMVAQSIHSSGGEYVNIIIMEVNASISISDLKSTWSKVCEVHEMLRTGFVATDDAQNPFVMILYSTESFEIPIRSSGGGIGSIMEDLRRPWLLSLVQEPSSVLMTLTIHHALFDAQSLQMILDDLAKALNWQQIGPRPTIKHLLGSILVDSNQDAASKKEFWKKEENKIIVNKFPDLTPLHVSETTSAVQEISSRKSTSELEGLCKESGVTMQAAGQAAWARLLAAYVGETSTTFGMTLSGRSIHEDADRISFPSIITLPVRCDITGTNSELLARTMESNAQLHKHQFTPLTSIQKWAGYPEGKIFDTLFAYQKVTASEGETEVPWKVIKEQASVDYAVSLELQPLVSGHLAMRLTFREDLVSSEHAVIMLGQYDALLLDILQNPQSACDVAATSHFGIDLLSVTPPKEYELSSEITLLHQFLERGTRQWPDKTAFEFATSLDPDNLRTKSWSYSQVEQEANKIANLLLQEGAQPGDIIAIYFDKCPEASFAIVGIMKAGCAYVALDPNAPIDRVKFILRDSGAKIVLTAGKPAQLLVESLEEKVIKLDQPNTFKKQSSNAPVLSRDIRPEDVSYCLYTSGTTGTPKGCLITHENAVQAMLSFQRLFAGHWNSESKWLQFASFHFDVSVLEQFWSWSVGICVASAPRDLIFEDIPGTIRQLGITHIDLTPSLARLLHPDDVPSLWKGVFITGGEQLRQEILDVWGDKGCIYNGYGPTEATIGVTMYPRVPRNGKPSNIGSQFDNVGSFVLKPGTTIPVLRGGIGELCVSGKLVGKGYLNRPDLTNERFPILTEFDERVYRTGDLVRILHDGTFIFLGRADDQVKLRGQRLELSEINEVIKKAVSDLSDVVTLVLKHNTQQKEQLVTFFVAATKPSTGFASVISDMKNACKSRLPGYMVPTHFIPIEKLPLNANNKADSKQLAVIYNELGVDELQKLSQSNSDTQDWNKAENKIVEIIAGAMNVDMASVTRNSSIFELGQDSISIIGFARALQNAGLENVKLSTVKNHPNIGALVAALSGSGSVDRGQESAYMEAKQRIAAFSQKHMVAVCQELDVEAASVEAVAPCTPVQEGMIFRFLENEGALYFNKFAFRVEESIDLEVLASAWRRVVRGAQVLRTRFVATDDGFAQIVVKESAFEWAEKVVDYTAMEKMEALKQPYSIALENDEHGGVMTIQMFHGLYDGISLNLLLERVVDEFRSTSNLDYGPRFQHSLPYGPLAKVEGAKPFWTEQLKDWSPKSLPLASDSQQDISAKLSVDQLSGFENLRTSLSVTPQAVLQAAWLSVLQTLIPDPTIGLVTSGRTIDFDNAENIIGPLFNTVPFHCPVSQARTFTDLIHKCHDFNMKMQDFQHTPLKDIQKWSPAQPGSPIFESLFVFQRGGDDGFAEGIWQEIEDEDVVADYPLAFEATMSLDGRSLGLVIVAQGGVISQGKAEELLGGVEETLRRIVDSGGDAVIDNNQAAEKSAPGTTLITSLRSRTTKGDVRNDFQWTDKATFIRMEIAQLAKVSVDSIHEHSSIFELGLDSIDVIKLSSRLKKRGIELPVSVIIRCQNIAQMSLKLSSAPSKPRENSLTVLKDLSQKLEAYLRKSGKLPEGTETVLPATPLQQSMVNEMIRSGYERYFNIDVLRIQEDVDVVKLIAAVTKAVENSPILSTRFVEVEDPELPVSYAQVIPKEKRFTPYRVDLGKSHYEDFDDLLATLKVDCTRKAIENGELFQVQFINDSTAKYFVMAAAHALYDGSSMRLLHDDIKTAYHDKLSSRPSFMPFLEEAVRSTTEEAKKFWRTTLSDIPHASLPTKDPPPKATTVHRLDRRSKVPFKAIEDLSKSSRVTLQSMAQTTYSLVLAHLTKQLEVLFGSVISCRDTEEANSVQFPLMNTVAVRSILHGTLSDMLTHIQNLSDMTRQYQHFPLGTAQAYALASRSHDGDDKSTRLFDSLFIYQGRRETAGETLYESVQGNREVEFPMCVEMEVVDGEIVWTIACKSDFCDERDTKAILDALDVVLERLVEDKEAQTIVSTGDGVSICGLPPFRTQSVQTKKSISQDPTEQRDTAWSQVEVKIRGALHELSGVPEDAIRQDLTIFHLGLDSILVLKLPALFRKSGIKLSVSDILREQTVQAMAKLAESKNFQDEVAVDVDQIIGDAVERVKFESGGAKLEELRESGAAEDVMPVTAGQLHMIRQWQASRGRLFYPTFSYQISGTLDKVALEQAWGKLCDRHAILRTGFIEVGDSVLQVVFKDPDNPVQYEESSVSHDLINPPLTLTIQNNNNKPLMKLRIHHALYDGISLPILLDDLHSLYVNINHAFPQPTSNFKQFIAQTLTSSSTTQEKWQSYLSSAPPKTRTKARHSNRTEIYHPSLPISSLKPRARELGISIDALLLASVAKKYAHHAHTAENLILGIYLANRAPFGEDLSSLAAPTLNLLPLLINDPLGRSVGDLAREIQHDVTRISNKDMIGASLDEIYNWTGVKVEGFVNIVKSPAQIPTESKPVWESIDENGDGAGEVEVRTDEKFPDVDESKVEAYPETLDIELRYHDFEGEAKIDIGVFAPGNRICLEDGEEFVRGFVGGF